MDSITTRELNDEGENHFENGDMVAARTCFELALKVSPSDQLATNNLGVLLWQSGKPGEALLEFSRVLSTSPDYQPAVLNASKILQANGQTDQARDLLSSFLSDYPGDSELEGVLQSLNENNITDEHFAQQSQATHSSNSRNNGVLPDGTNNAEISFTAAHVEKNGFEPLSSEEPLVSIIIPTKDRPEFLRDTLESLNAQSYTNWEAIIVNDGGKDVQELIQTLDHHNRFRYIRHETSRGSSSARNTGIKHSNGDVLCYLDDDDMFMPHHLKTVVETLYKNQASFVYTEAEYAHEKIEDGRRRVTSRNRPYSGIEYSRDRLHIVNFIPINTWAHRRELLQYSGLFDTGLKALVDWDLLLRFSRLVEFAHIPIITVEVRMRNSGGQDHISLREREGFPSLFRKIYARYNVDNEELVHQRECQLKSLDNERPSTANNKATEIRTEHSKPFSGSKEYWIERYNSGGNSGDGSYRKLAEFKAEILNGFVQQHNINSVIEHGCGDGNQLKLAKYPSYIGFDVSPKAIALCTEAFSGDTTKTFKLVTDYSNETAELTLSLDVIYHLIEDEVFTNYMQRLFDTSRRYVIIYSSNTNENSETQAAHVKHRKFSEWIAEVKPEWKLQEHILNRFPFNGDNQTGSFSEFFIYKKAL